MRRRPLRTATHGPPCRTAFGWQAWRPAPCSPAPRGGWVGAPGPGRSPRCLGGREGGVGPGAEPDRGSGHRGGDQPAAGGAAALPVMPSVSTRVPPWREPQWARQAVSSLGARGCAEGSPWRGGRGCHSWGRASCLARGAGWGPRGGHPWSAA
eukprot:2125484-Pyramimonas_sp.AAC.2